MNKKMLITMIVIIGVLAAAYVIALCMARKESAEEESRTATVSGEVFYRERIALPAGSIVEVALQDVSKADAPAEVIGQFSTVTAGENVPVPFEIAYDPSVIDARHTYAVSARILVEDSLRWTSTEHIPVITGGNPTQDVSIMLTGVSDDNASAATGAPAGEQQPATVSLKGSTFRLAVFNGVTMPESEQYAVTFDDKDKLHAKFCNNMNGSYVLADGTITGQLASTLMLCQQPTNLMKIEDTFGGMLSKGAKLSLKGTVLTLSLGTDMMVFVAEK